jgi:hypothetical protein
MKILVPTLFCLSLLGQTFAHDPASEMTTAAKNFLDSLDDSEKKKAHFPFSDKERENWHFFLEVLLNPMGGWVYQ